MTRKARNNRPGRPPKHGGFSLMVRAGEIPERVTHIRAYLTWIREGLIRDVAGEEANLTAAQVVLIDRAISILGVIRTVEESLAEVGIMKAGVLAGVLQDNYLAYCNSLRLILRELGIDKKAGEKILSPLEIAAEIDKEKTAKDKGEREKGRGEFVDPGASQREIDGGPEDE